MSETAVADAPVSAPASPAPAANPPVAAFEGSAVNLTTDLRNNPEFEREFDNPDIHKPPVFPDKGLPPAAPKVKATPKPEVEQTPAEEWAQAAETEATGEAEPVEAEATPVEATGDNEFPIPDDVAVQTTREGTKQYVMPETRFNEYHNSLKTIRDAEAALGEPLTQDLLEQMAVDSVSMQNLQSRFISPKPESHLDILTDLAKMSDDAVARGDTRYNSLATLAAQMPQFLQQRNPMAYELQKQAYLQREGPKYFYEQAPGFVRNMLMGLAGELQNRQDPNSKSQYASVQHLSKMLYGEWPMPDGSMQRDTSQIAFNPFRPNGNQNSQDPTAQQRQQLQQERRQWEYEQQQRAEASWRDQISNHDNQVAGELKGVVKDILKPVAPNYEKIPKALDGVTITMLQLVNDGIAKDERWQQMRQNMLEDARAAASETRRAEILQQLQQRYKAKAKTILDPLRNKEVREVLSQKARQVVAENQAQVARAKTAGSQRQPSAGGATRNKGILPPPADVSPGLKTADEIRAMIMAD